MLTLVAGTTSVKEVGEEGKISKHTFKIEKEKKNKEMCWVAAPWRQKEFGKLE